jgi:type II secretory pathway component GspD/PulD (secretin)
MKVAAEAMSNTLVLHGPEEQVETISRLMHELDQSPVDLQTLFVYPLKNAVATDMRDVLMNVFGPDGLFKASYRGWGGSPATILKVIADPRTNSLLLTVNPAYEVQVREIIAALDKPLEQRVPETRPGRSDFIGPRAPSAP